ncbi:MAG TPA: T9SS type A sorting domain-containing protein [Prolixibacteraceae bacterium]|nr:T9SS type A sorting domain-containing protein [Prolixibacteraceae bacterium]
MKILSFSLTNLLLISFLSLKAQTINFSYADTVYPNDNFELINIVNNPTFDSVKVFPRSPSENDYIKIVVFISNESTYKQFIGSCRVTISNDSIKLPIPSIELSSTPTTKLIDTINIGKLTPKDYKVVLTNKRQVIFGGPEGTSTSYIDTANFTVKIKALTSTKLISNKFYLYPNPTSDFLYLKNIGQNQEIEKVSIFDLQGKSIMDYKNKSVLDLRALVNGIYMLRINLKNGTVYTQQIIKK